MSTKSLRTAYGETLVELGKDNKDIVVLEADLGKSTMSILFQNAYPERYFEMGIAEQNMASTAAGLALTGKIPFISSFAVFASGRAYDQLRQTISIAKLNVKICGSSSGLSDFGDGSTHQAIEDMAIMRAIPNMTVLVPVDAVETSKMVKAMVSLAGAGLPAGQPQRPAHPHERGRRLSNRQALHHEGRQRRRCLRQRRHGLKGSGGGKIAGGAGHIGESRQCQHGQAAGSAGGHRLRQGIQRGGTAEEHSVIGGLGSAIAEALRGRNAASRWSSSASRTVSAPRRTTTRNCCVITG